MYCLRLQVGMWNEILCERLANIYLVMFRLHYC